MKKKSIKMFITAFAVCAVSAMAVMFSGCSVKDTLNQLKCKHEYGEIVVIEESTCTDNGKGEQTCSKCDWVKSVKLELKEHTAVYVEGVIPTCVKTGLTSGTKCSVCDTVITECTEVPAYGHIVVKDKAIEPTCLETGLSEGTHCSRCLETLEKQEVVPALGHKPVVLEAVAPTCTTEGKSQGVKCGNCSEVFAMQETIPIIEHEFENGVCNTCGAKDAVAYLSLFENENNYTEKSVNIGDKVAGKVYRLYKTTYESEGVGAFTSIGFTGESTIKIFSCDNDGSENCNAFCGSNTYIADIPCVIYDEYIDFYLPEGLMILSHSCEKCEDFIQNQGAVFTLIIDNTTAIESLTKAGFVFELVLNNE